MTIRLQQLCRVRRSQPARRPRLPGETRHNYSLDMWHTLATLGRWCRIKSYLDTAAAHGTGALDAVRAVIERKPWLPPLPAIN